MLNNKTKQNRLEMLPSDSQHSAGASATLWGRSQKPPPPQPPLPQPPHMHTFSCLGMCVFFEAESSESFACLMKLVNVRQRWLRSLMTSDDCLISGRD